MIQERFLIVLLFPPSILIASTAPYSLAILSSTLYSAGTDSVVK
jgi:hypothetical protein